MRKVYRKKNSKLGGVCHGLADYFDIDETLVRLFFVVLFFTPFPIILSYFIMWIVIPKEN